MPARAKTRKAMEHAHTNIGTPMMMYAWNMSLIFVNRSCAGRRGGRRSKSASGCSLMRDRLAIQSVSIEMMIISIEDNGCGRPKNTGNRIGQSSQKVPAGKR